MAHFARISDGIVQQVIVVSNDDAPTEPVGQAFSASISLDGEWIQTSYNSNFRGTYAGIGYTWNGTDFVAPESPIEV